MKTDEEKAAEKAKELENAKEFSRRRNTAGVDIRRMMDKRSHTLKLSYCGSDLGSRTEFFTRGKLIQTLYVLPEIHENVKKNLKGY
jgi:hypothetical protein